MGFFKGKTEETEKSAAAKPGPKRSVGKKRSELEL